MPCYDDRGRDDWKALLDEAEELRKVANKADKLAGMLCMVLTTLEEENELGHFKELFDYKGSGITREELMVWWREHKAEDCVRRERERVEAKRQAALAKLTPEECELLGVK